MKIKVVPAPAAGLDENAGQTLSNDTSCILVDGCQEAVGGGERLRIWTVNFLRFGSVLGIGLAVVLSRGARATYRKSNLRSSRRRLSSCPLADRAIWAQLKDDNRRDFHPDDSGTTPLVESWRATLFGEDGTLKDKLIRAAA